MAIDIKNQVLFIAALGNNSIEVVDLLKGESIFSVKGIDEPQGIAFIPQNNTICVSSGTSGDCNFYDAKTFSLLNSVKLGSDADNMRFDASSNLIFSGFGDGGIKVIDAIKQTPLSTIIFTGHPESFQIDKIGKKIFINVPSEKAVVIADYTSGKVTNTWNINDAASNFPMAIDEKNQRLFIGCCKPPVLIVYNSETGAELCRFDIRKDIDDIFYDELRKYIYISCGEGYLQVFQESDLNKFKLNQEVKTTEGARTSLYIPESKKLYLAVPKSDGNDASIQIYNILN
jgi:WD40 repeat protein